MAIAWERVVTAWCLWQLYADLPLMVDSGVITQAQSDTLEPIINDMLHQALGL